MYRFLVFVSSCCCFFLGFIAATDTLMANQSLRDSESLVSNGNIYKLSFFSPGNSSFRYVGIMYNTIPQRTVVWVANRNLPINDHNGTLKISEDGNLVVLDGHNDVLWSSNVSNSFKTNCSLQLLNSGNLVLKDDLYGQFIWESFRHASDSLLPDMKLFTDINTNESNVITSWTSHDDPAPGRFSATIEPLNVPQLYVWNGKSPYWRSGPWNGQYFVGMRGLSNTYQRGFDLTNEKPGTAYVSFTCSNVSILPRFILHASGILELDILMGRARDLNFFKTTADTDCDVYGKCGPFASCEHGKKVICSCFQGFNPISIDEWNAGNWTRGCTRRTPLHCSSNSPVKDNVFVAIKSVKVPDNFKWISIGDGKEYECKEWCMERCSCIAYAFPVGVGCLFWTDSLVDVQIFTQEGSDLYIRLARSELGHNIHRIAIIVAIAVLGFIFFIVSICCLWKRLYRHKVGHKSTTKFNWKSSPTLSIKSFLKADVQGVMLEDLKFFDFEMISNATNQFDSINMLGQGGFGPVYKGKLPNGQDIAVKRHGKSSKQGQEEFINEVQVISKLQHRNLVKILGCCVECEENMLIYEFMPNGSLDNYIFDSHKQALIDWKQRGMIIERICLGLLYLHRDSRLKIIHRDLKASNILLDQEMNPKISDFGTARIFGREDDQANTKRVVGTYGYMAPEYVLQGIFSEKTDVYSFGVLLLEILIGVKNNNFHHKEHGFGLIPYSWRLWNDNEIPSLKPPEIYDVVMEKEMSRYVQIGLLCVQDMAHDRPTISTVLSMLTNQNAEFPNPKQPTFSIIQAELSDQFSSKSMSNNVTFTTIEAR